MRRRVLSRYLFLVAMLIPGMTGPVESADSATDRLTAGGVLLLRHAIAPGLGDPEDFRIDDCSTQRNLSEAGRQQAIAIGAWL